MARVEMMVGGAVVRRLTAQVPFVVEQEQGTRLQAASGIVRPALYFVKSIDERDVEYVAGLDRPLVIRRMDAIAL
jgi:hypothetical protein